MSETEFDPWRTLGVPVGAKPSEIKRAFRGLARRMHPDVSRDSERAHEQFIRLRQAYETLMDDEMRAALEARVLGEDTESLLIIDEAEVGFGDAYELLERGYVEEARAIYLEMAQTRPGDPRLLELLQTIHEVEDHGVGAAAGATTRAAGAGDWEQYRDLWQPEPVAIRWWLVGAAALVAVACTWAVSAVEAPAAVGPYSMPEIALAAAAGFLVAALAAAGGALGSFDLELGDFVGDTRYDVPVWLYLGVAGVLSPVLALVFYVVFVLLQAQWSWSAAAFFAGTFALAAALGWAHDGAPTRALLLGSNAIFVPGLVGWAIGSIFRPGYWWE